MSIFYRRDLITDNKLEKRLETEANLVNGKVPESQLPPKADLVNGKVPAGQLPSYVDDVLEVANLAALPATGETGKIYITIDTGLIYRWGGSVYVQIPTTPAQQEKVEILLSTINESAFDEGDAPWTLPEIYNGKQLTIIVDAIEFALGAMYHVIIPFSFINTIVQFRFDEISQTGDSTTKFQISKNYDASLKPFLILPRTTTNPFPSLNYIETFEFIYNACYAILNFTDPASVVGYFGFEIKEEPHIIVPFSVEYISF